MARRFQFRLQPLLRLRKALEEEAQRHLARMIDLRMAAEAELNALRADQEASIQGKRVAPGQLLDVQRLRALERYLVMLERRLVLAAQALQEAEARVRDAREALAKAHQAHLTLLRLKERRQEQHAFEVLQEELRVADELAVLRYRFNTRSREVQ